MPRGSVTAFVTGSWTIHDTWTECLVGTRHLVYHLLPAPGARMDAETRTLCQLALIASNHLMEIALFKVLCPSTSGSGQVTVLTAQLLREASYFEMLTRWVTAASGIPLDLKAEPFVSTERLRRRRNDTIHKSSASANPQMARSALGSAVAGTEALFSHFSLPFPYAGFLARWPLEKEPAFSSVTYPK
jgi:hypothetical protein